MAFLADDYLIGALISTVLSSLLGGGGSGGGGGAAPQAPPLPQSQFNGAPGGNPFPAAPVVEKSTIAPGASGAIAAPVAPAGISAIQTPAQVAGSQTALQDIESRVTSLPANKVQRTEPTETAGGSLSKTLLNPQTIQALAALASPGPASNVQISPRNIQSSFNPAGINPFQLSQQLALARRR